MKAVLTLIFVLFVSTAAFANNGEVAPKKSFANVELGTEVSTEEVKEVKVARLYRRSNSKITKELNFTTKRNKAKLA